MASVIVHKTTDRVRDASDRDDLNYDPAVYDNLHPAVNPVAAGDPPGKYFRDGGGNIIKRPTTELRKDFEDEKQLAIRTEITTIQADATMTAATKDAIINAPNILSNQ